MSRKKHAIAVGVLRPLTQRGNRRQSVFITDDDRRQYLDWLTEYMGRCEMQVWEYCLMTNHVHLVASPLVRIGVGSLYADDAYAAYPTH